jgi:hypothetical protein
MWGGEIMQYILQIHCEVPETYPAGNENSKALSKQKPQARSITIKEFDSKESLFYFVRRYDYVNKHGKRGNKFLEATMTLPNDALRHRFMDRYCYPSTYKCVGYYLKNSEGRTIDLRHYTDELQKFDIEAYFNKLNSEQHRSCLSSMESAEWYAELAEKKANAEKLYGYGWDGISLRGFRTKQERRWACDKEHKPFIRGKRRKLPEPWGTEIHTILSKSWKDRRKSRDRNGLDKYKHQWNVNLPRHIDSHE